MTAVLGSLLRCFFDHIMSGALVLPFPVIFLLCVMSKTLASE